MKILVTGAGGLIGSEASRHWLNKNAQVLGIDNNSRKRFFGVNGDTSSTIAQLSQDSNFMHLHADIRDRETINYWMLKFKPDLVLHCAAQPSHDKAASIPYEDFEINAVGTLNMLEAFRSLNSKDPVFIYVSTNKVYGDAPNKLLLSESDLRYDFDKNSQFSNGIDESLTIDQSTHSLFGVSKTSGDLLAQEYGKYFDLKVGIFRGGCLTGPQHASVELHGFLSYIVKCAKKNTHYKIFGYKGKQVRDQIHSADVISAFDHFVSNPTKGEVYNLGGGIENSASILEIINILNNDHNLSLDYSYVDNNRVGDHICYYTDMKKFKLMYPSWKIERSLQDIIGEIVFEGGK